MLVVEISYIHRDHCQCNFCYWFIVIVYQICYYGVSMLQNDNTEKNVPDLKQWRYQFIECFI